MSRAYHDIIKYQFNATIYAKKRKGERGDKVGRLN